MPTVDLPRLIRTTRHLRWSQIAYRLRRETRRRLGHGASWSSEDEIAAMSTDPRCPEVPATTRTNPSGRDLVDRLEAGEFRHLNESRWLGRSPTDWLLGSRHADRLWTVTLHYHAWIYDLALLAGSPDSAAGQAARLLAEYLDDWLIRCDLSQPGAEPLAWNPYAIATRLGWWCRSFRLLDSEFFAGHPGLRQRMLRSMWRQASYLESHLEWDLRANHLLRDAVGLAWAGRFFEGGKPARWLKTATRLAVQQADEQILPDGGHFERSPLYHLEVMDDWLTLATLLKEPACAKMQEAWQRMAASASWFTHPDDCIAALNDSVIRSMHEHVARGSSAGLQTPINTARGGRYFGDTGLVVWHGRPWTIFFDVGEIGPDCQPGHAHADTLNLECSFGSQRLFVDPGCLGYDNDFHREYDRSTRAHNTVCIDGQDSSEVWHIFRVGRRARPRDVQVSIESDGMKASASHTGYDHLQGKPRHERHVHVTDHGSLEIVDRIHGGGRHRVEGGFLLAPSWSATQLSDGWRICCGRTRLRICVEANLSVCLAMEERAWHPDYGVEIPTTRLQWRYSGELPLEVKISVCPETAGRLDDPPRTTCHSGLLGSHPQFALAGEGATR